MQHTSCLTPFLPRRRRSAIDFGGMLLNAVVWLGGLAMLFPLVWMILTSLKPAGSEFQIPPEFWSDKLQPGNFLTAGQRMDFVRACLNTLIVTGSVTAGQLVTCSMAGFAFSKMEFPGRDKMFLLYLATLMIPTVVTLIPLFEIMRWLGWIDSYKALIIPSIFSAYGTFLLRQAFLGIPQALIDSARVDGCGPLRILWYLVLPLSKPSLVALAIITLIGSWREFLWPLVVTNSSQMRTLTVGLATYRGSYGSDWNLLMAASCMTMLPLILVFLFAQRFFIEGIQMAGIKE